MTPPEAGGTKMNAQKKQIGTTWLLNNGDIYDVDFLDDQDEFANCQFVNADMCTGAIALRHTGIVQWGY